MFELSLLAAFGAMICWGIGDFLIQRTVRKVGDIEALAFIGIVGSVGLIPFVWNDLKLILHPGFALMLFVLEFLLF